MGIAITTQGFDKFMAKATRILTDSIIMQLQYLGLECVNKARNRSAEDSWCDRTGNLRSSIGMAVYKEGEKIAQSAFEQVGAGGEGSQVGKSFVEKIAKEYQSAYTLVIVAAMDYAEYVEYGGSKNRKPHDVLASTEAWARGVVNERIQDGINNAIAKINALSFN